MVDPLRQQRRIQTVESFHNNDGIFLQMELMPLPDTLAQLKIKDRQFYLLAGQKLRDLQAEQVGIDGVDMLQIQLAIGTGQDLIPVDIVIVQPHQNGLLSVYPELGCQPVAGGGLARGAGAGQHDCLCAPLADHVSHLGVTLLVQRFIDTDQFPDPSVHNKLI